MSLTKELDRVVGGAVAASDQNVEPSSGVSAVGPQDSSGSGQPHRDRITSHPQQQHHRQQDFDASEFQTHAKAAATVRDDVTVQVGL